MSAEAGFAAAYAVLLVAIALGLDLLARHSHRRSERYRTAGFRFLAELDGWECPEGELLRRHETDHQRRVIRYRAPAAVCNSCPAKADCTDSDEGRELVHAMDPWPHSEAGRFHRGICVVLVVLAALISAVALIRSDGPTDALVLGALLALSVSLAGRLFGAFRRTPSGFPAADEAAQRLSV